MMSASESTPTLMSWLTFNPNREARHGTVPRMRSGHRAAVVERLREVAPYAAIVMLPAGSLLAFVLWLYHRKKNASLVPT